MKVNHHINKINDKNHNVISVDVEKTFDKIHHPLMIKALKLGIKGDFLNVIKCI